MGRRIFRIRHNWNPEDAMRKHLEKLGRGGIVEQAIKKLKEEEAQAATKPIKPPKKASKPRCGLSFEEYDRMFVLQNGKCAICEGVESIRLAVDHDHDTGKIRALLCSKCNTALGFIKDNKETAFKMAAYLEEHGK